jgi:hypothetical protein
MQKTTSLYLSDDSAVLDYKMIHKKISDKWEKKARDLQKRRWRVLKKQTRAGKHL